MNRREIFKYGLAGVAATAFSSNVMAAQVKQSGTKSVFAGSFLAPLPNAKGPRVVVVGGGWSGLAVAKYAKKFSPNADVVLVERRAEFVSCPMSNLYLVGEVNLEYLTHDYLQAARENGYIFFNATATGVDKKNKMLKTSHGDIKYDYLVLSVGIDYDYAPWGVDAAVEQRLRIEYPAAFIPGSEHMTLKNKIKNFKGGNFILTVPGGNYRCFPAPYERACLVADYFKKNNIAGKIILLDENPEITIKKDGFQSAFEEMYKEYITYVPAAKITNIDLDKKVVIAGEMGDEYKFDDASFYPHVRGGKLLELCDVAKDTAFNKLEGNIDPFTYEVLGAQNKNIFVSGDARPMGYSKSGNTANTEGRYLAQLIAQRILNGKDIAWRSPLTRCYSVVSTKPQRAISVKAEYKFEGKTLAGFTNVELYEDWKSDASMQNATMLNEWADGLYADMFSKGD